MAEPGGFDLRRLLLTAGVLAVVIFSVLFFIFRSCAPGGPTARKPGYTVIYSNLELKDAANVITRLKELDIQYEIRDDGRAIAVQKEKADLARMGLAEKNLPTGGSVGWEIFNEARLGATDFDRRIQLIRAISGELGRTIRQIKGVDDCRVQVVIPETKLFAATTAPVTAAVLLRLRPGFVLAPEKINGIVYLVASSVENLQPENVTVVDDTGRILTVRPMVPIAKPAAMAPPPAESLAEMVTPETPANAPEIILTKVRPVSPEVTVAKTGPVNITAEAQARLEAKLTQLATLSAEERIILKVQTKKELEQDLSGKAQELVNRFYPINSIIVKVALDVKPAKDNELKSKELKVKRVNAIVLIDNRVDFSANLKMATFSTIAAAIGYNKKRGDKIIIQRVPFHLATPAPEIVIKNPIRPAGVATPAAPGRGLSFLTFRRIVWLSGGLVVLIIFVWLAAAWRRGRSSSQAALSAPSVAAPEGAPGPRGGKLEQMRTMAENNPEQIAELMKKWLSE
ncbi:MAG: flagellar basal-body MS-ring/collar protein FliF [Candidatus Margulisiibacteriota bacterium]